MDMWTQQGKEKVGQTERLALTYTHNYVYWGFLGGSMANNLSANAGDARDASSIPWSRKRHPTPLFLPGKFHGQRSLLGYSPWSCKESDMTEHTEKLLHSTRSSAWCSVMT